MLDQPESAEAMNRRGLQRRAQADLDGALADFNRALELKPDLAAGYSTANLNFEEFLAAADAKGIFRGF